MPVGVGHDGFAALLRHGAEGFDVDSAIRRPHTGRRHVGAGVRRAFDAFDRNKNGYLEVRELRDALGYLGLACDREAAAGVLRRYDDDMNGRLDVHEFNELVHELLRHEPVGVDVRRVFEDFDRNRNGHLEARELREALRALGFEADASATLAVLQQFDEDLDCRLDLHEFGALAQELARIQDWLGAA